MSSRPVPSLAQAGSGHWRCPLYEEEGEDDGEGYKKEWEHEQGRRWVGNGEAAYILKLTLA